MYRFFSVYFILMTVFVLDSHARVSRVVSVSTRYGVVEFEVHGRDSDLEFIKRVEKILVKDARPILEYFRYRPTTPIHFGVNNGPFMANGFATVIPRNYSELISWPPLGESSLLSGEDYVKGLVLHELTHIIHMDQTRGFLSVLRFIFGSFGKWGGIVPHWFSEGLATWAETEFTEGGRLDHKLVRYELDHFLLDDKNCRTVDCLDSPETYPYGKIPYWVGGLFLQWLEKQREGTLRCLVIENSDNIPFILSDAFYKCTGRGMNYMFLEFRQKYKEKRMAEINKFQNSSFVKKNMKSLDIMGVEAGKWDSGHVVVNDKLLFLRHRDRVNRIVVRDLKNEKEKEFSPEFPIQYILPSTPYTRKYEKAVFSTHGRFPTQLKRSSYEFDLKTGEWQELDLDGGDYPFILSKDHFLYFEYEDHRWSLWRKIREKKQKIYELDTLVQMSHPRLIRSDKRYWLIFKTFTPNVENGHGLWAYPAHKKLDGGALSLYQDRLPFELWGDCEGEVLFRPKNGDLYGLKLLANEVVRRKHFQTNWADQVVSLKWGAKKSAFLFKDDPFKVYQFSQSCPRILKKLAKKIKPKKEIKAKAPPVAKKEKIEESESYPSARHFIPRHWMLGYVSGLNLSSWLVSTSINDPMSVHQMGLTLKYFNNISELATDITYVYNWRHAQFGIGQFKDFTQSSLKSTPDEILSQFAFIDKRSTFARFKNSLSLTVAKSKKVDFLSDREFQSVSVNESIISPSKFYDSFWQMGVLDLKATFVDNLKFDDYMQWDIYAKQRVRILRNLDFTGRVGYSKQDNIGLASGAIFGGGVSDLSFSTVHEFYGLQSNDAFGKEMTSIRGQFDANLFRWYRSLGPLPVFVKDIDLLFGADYLNTDFIFVNSGLYSDRKIHSTHFGLRSSITFFYNAPIDIDWIFYETGGKNLPKTNGSEFIVSSSFSF